MLGFDPTPEQEALREMVHKFAANEIRPRAAEWDRNHTFPRELLGELGELGLMGVCVPAEQGGAGADRGDGKVGGVEYVQRARETLHAWPVRPAPEGLQQASGQAGKAVGEAGPRGRQRAQVGRAKAEAE